MPPLYDNHNRPITYLRLAVTDRCNLRCFYCMPAEGIPYLPKQQLLTYEEIERVVYLLAAMGIQKIRITGGEPFVRRDLMYLLQRISRIPGIQEIHITTNGVLAGEHITALKALGIASVNLSLDTLDRQRFLQITRRDALPQVLDCFQALLANDIPTKINAVVMEGQNTDDIIPLAELSRQYPISVRFIEEMPFNGQGNHYRTLVWNHRRILHTLQAYYPGLQKLPDALHSTSTHYRIPGYRGTVGIIAAFSRTFCGTCNRIRLTAQGTLKTCLYDDGVLDVRQRLRSGATDQELQQAFITAFHHRAPDGFAAEQRRDLSITESMATIGG